MTVLIDIGNSRTKYCYVNKANIPPFSQITVVDNESFNENYFIKYFINAGNVVVANVASKTLTTNLAQWCKGQQLDYREVSSEKKRGDVISAYERPQDLGVDRWLTLLAVAKLYPNKNVLIIDAGTATTIDLLAASGQHLGGWILAGISTLFTSVLKETAKVNAQLSKNSSIGFGLNTTSNVNNACWAATVGLINQAISQAKQEVEQLDEVIITGGNGKALQKLMSVEMTQIDKLVFYGLDAYN